MVDEKYSSFRTIKPNEVCINVEIICLSHMMCWLYFVSSQLLKLNLPIMMKRIWLGTKLIILETSITIYSLNLRLSKYRWMHVTVRASKNCLSMTGVSLHNAMNLLKFGWIMAHHILNLIKILCQITKIDLMYSARCIVCTSPEKDTGSHLCSKTMDAQEFRA